MRGYVLISLVVLTFSVNLEKRPIVGPAQIVELTGAAIDDAMSASDGRIHSWGSLDTKEPPHHEHATTMIRLSSVR
jgi:hypothetical protein